MEKYIRVILEQVRYHKSHESIRRELQDHLEEQYKANREAGMSEIDAEKAAVEEMGDPVEVGISLDRIHRPKMAWDMLLLMSGITMFSIIIHVLIGDPDFAYEGVVGFSVMLVVYLLDYTWFLYHAKPLAGGFLLLWLFLLHSSGAMYNGAAMWIILPIGMVSLLALPLCYIPLYGALLYQYYGKGYSGLGKSILWMIAPLLLSYYNIPLRLMLLFVMLLQLSLAIKNRWFVVPIRRTLTCLWGLIIAISGVIFGMIMGENGYQRNRLLAFLSNQGDANYLTGLLRENLTSGFFLGASDYKADLKMLGADSDFILSYLTASYGLWLSLLLCCVLMFVIVRAYKICLKQKNQAGKIMGCGCTAVLALHIVINIMENAGVFPVTTTFLPFLSAGLNVNLISYVMIGIILSIYRYKDVHGVHVKLSASKMQEIESRELC